MTTRALGGKKLRAVDAQGLTGVLAIRRTSHQWLEAIEAEKIK